MWHNNFAPLWQPPIDREIKAHDDNGIWEIVDESEKPPHAKLVDTRWVFDIVRYDRLRLILIIAVILGWQLWQMDFDAAYLNDKLSHIIYARCPPGVNRYGGNKILRLLKTLYGLKQSGREWYEVLSQWLKQMGFYLSTFDPCVFLGIELILGIYVDDVLMAGTNPATSAFMKAAGGKFKFKDLGRPKMLLGLEIDYGDSLRLHQRTYTMAVLRRYGMDQYNGRRTPLDANSFSSRSEVAVCVDRQHLCQSIIGSIAIISRPDLAYTVSMLGTYNSNPSELHLRLAYQVLRYIRQT